MSVFVVTVMIEAAAVGLSWGLEPGYDTLLYAVFSSVMAGTGALILTRHPRHPIGWLLCGIGVANALTADLAQGWGLRAAAEGWPGGVVAEWIATASFLPQGTVFVLTLLLFPDGRLPGRRWRLVVWLSVVGALLAELGWALNPDAGRWGFMGGRNPFAVQRLPTEQLFAAGLAILTIAMAASLVAVGHRFRRSAGVERQQLKWFVFSGAILVLCLPAAAALWRVTPLVHVLPALALTAWPVAIAVPILRYRLYDVDLVISRTIAYGALTAIVGLVYAVTVLVLGIGAGRGSAWATAGATLAAAAMFHLLRQRVQHQVDRRFRRARHDALHSVAQFLEALRGGRAEPEQVAAVLSAALGDPGLELRFVLRPGEPPVDERGQPVAEPCGGGRERYAVKRAGVTLGEIVWRPGTGEQRALLPTLADAAGLAIEMARLRVELRRRLDEVEASRARLVAVADEERRRIERDLHDGAQQRLVSIGLALRHAQHELGPAVGEAGRVLDEAVTEITVAIDELRELAQGVRPALLDAGLRPALRDLASRAPLTVEVAATAERFPPEVETAAYFVACEGLTNAVKHAGAERVMLRAAREDGRFVISVTDDGAGGAALRNGSGLTGLSDRVAARGGNLLIDSVEGRGTRLTAEFPCAS